jgi:hypothetical protein
MLTFREQVGTITTNGNIVEINTDTNGAVGVGLLGTWTGTVQFEVTVDGQNWFAVKDKYNGGSATSATANGLFQFAVAGFKAFRVRASATVTGSLQVALHASEVPTS